MAATARRPPQREHEHGRVTNVSKRSSAATSKEDHEGKTIDAHDVAVVVKRPSPPSATMLRGRRPWMITIALAVAVAVAAVVVSVAFHGRPSAQEPSSLAVSVGAGDSESSSATDDHDHDTRAFLEWFQRRGGHVSDAITITRFDGMGRGILAQRAIHEHDVLLHVPMDLIICKETIYSHVSQELLPKFQKIHHSGEELLTAFLVIEQLKNGSSSSWAPYLNVLPAYPTTFDAITSPLFFENARSDLEELQDDRMVQAATQEKRKAKIAYQRFRRLFKSVLPTTRTTKDTGIPLEKRYLWARFLVNSRAFSIRGDRFLVPFGDIFNGSPQPQRREQGDASGNGAQFLHYHRLQPGKGMEIRADRAVEVAGAQVFEDYGDNDNYIYFLYHGFLMADNPFDCASVRLPALSSPTTSSSDEMKHKIYRDFFREEAATSPFVCVTEQGFVRSAGGSQDTQALQLVTSLATMDTAHMDAWCRESSTRTMCLSHATQADQDELLLQAIQQQLKSYATSLDEDMTLLQQRRENPEKPLRPAQRHAVQFRVSRKQILVSAIQRIQQRIAKRTERLHAINGVVPSTDNDQQQQHQHESALDAKIARFSHWIEQLQFPINHIALQFVSPSMGYGAFATKPLTKGEIYLSVPTETVMDLHSAARSPFVRDWILHQRSESSGSGSIRWTESQLLILHLLHEKLAPDGHESFWRPYLDVLPEMDRLASPLFYSTTSVEMTLLHEALPEDLWILVDGYRRRVDSEYEQLTSSTSSRRLPQWISLDQFRWATAILDSRSIWWSRSRHLVPLLDMVNCMELSPHHHAHATTLDDQSRADAVTRASWGFARGDHVVENYAQPNYIYLLYHGFVLHENSHDCAHFHFELTLASRLAKQHHDRAMVIAIMERLQLYSWTQDLCVSSSTSTTSTTSGSSIDKLLTVSLIAQSPQKAAELERAFPGELTQQHVDAATLEISKRLSRLERAIHAHQDNAAASPVLTFIKQQHTQMSELLSAVKTRGSDLV